MTLKVDQVVEVDRTVDVAQNDRIFSEFPRKKKIDSFNREELRKRSITKGNDL